MNITITKTTHPGTLPPSDQLGFGTVFTDHMFLMDYSADKGWHDARVVPYGPITMSPAASVLHYGTEVFEGLKAYRRPDGGVQRRGAFGRAADARLCRHQSEQPADAVGEDRKAARVRRRGGSRHRAL